MKFLIIFLASAILVTASISGSKSIYVQEDGTITIHGENGKRLVISKQMGPHGQIVEIEVTAPNAIHKTIQIDDNNQIEFYKDQEHDWMTKSYTSHPKTLDFDEIERQKRSKTPKSQTDMLGEIMKEYRGVVDEKSYEKLLSKVEKYVKEGKISSTVLSNLQALAGYQPWEGSVKDSMNPKIWQGVDTYTPYGHQGMWMGKQWPQEKWYPHNWMGQGNVWQNGQGSWEQMKSGQMPWWPHTWTPQNWMGQGKVWQKGEGTWDQVKNTQMPWWTQTWTPQNWMSQGKVWQNGQDTWDQVKHTQMPWWSQTWTPQNWMGQGRVWQSGQGNWGPMRSSQMPMWWQTWNSVGEKGMPIMYQKQPMFNYEGMMQMKEMTPVGTHMVPKAPWGQYWSEMSPIWYQQVPVFGGLMKSDDMAHKNIWGNWANHDTMKHWIA